MAIPMGQVNRSDQLDQPFEVYVMPISGTDFVRYPAAISILAEYRKSLNLDPFKPRVIYAASGGCLAAILSMMSSFGSRVEEWRINSKMFIERATPITPRLLTLALRGYMYHRTDLTEYARSILVPSKIQDVEIVTGYYEMQDPTTYKPSVKIVSNYEQADSILNDQFVPSSTSSLALGSPRNANWSAPNISFVFAPVSLSGSNERIEHLDKVTDLMIDALHKTSNIPYMMESLGEASCIDYGIVAPSPRIVANANMDRSIYFSPVNIDNAQALKDYNLIFHKMIMNDILSLRNSFDQAITCPDMINVIQLIGSSSRYCLVIYSAVNTDIPITDFDETIIRVSIQSCKAAIRFLLLFDRA